MDWLEQIWNQIINYVSVPYLLTFMFLAYTVKKNFGKLLQKITKFDWKSAYTVLAIATIVAIPFLIWTEETPVKIIVTYAVGTSLHELLFKFIESKITNK